MEQKQFSASASNITGFDLIMDSTGTFSTSSVVTGKIYASDYASPTPSKMTTAVSDMETAYTGAAGRTNPDYTELYAGDVTGETLTPGLYKWDTGVLISEGGVTISGTSSDVWIFQIAEDLTVADGAIVSLSGGAKAANIFWQVAGQVTIGTTAEMKGNILCQSQIAFNTGASLVGRALSQTAVTLDANAITAPTDTDTVPPTVSSTVPSDSATGVAINIAITATFSEEMDPNTISSNTFILKQGTAEVSGTVTYSGVTAVFKPQNDLDPDTIYTVTVKGGGNGVKDLAGNPMGSDHVWSFDTGLETLDPPFDPPVDGGEAYESRAENAASNGAATFLWVEGYQPWAALVINAGDPAGIDAITVSFEDETLTIEATDSNSTNHVTILINKAFADEHLADSEGDLNIETSDAVNYDGMDESNASVGGGGVYVFQVEEFSTQTIKMSAEDTEDTPFLGTLMLLIAMAISVAYYTMKRGKQK
ncbi:MAG: ice-binding family protein [Thermoplasmata archaeon]